jgi:uncharacterized protein (DUF302 family)
MTRTVAGVLEEVRPRVEAALKQQGFGVLTEIDVQATMREKIGVDYEPFLILGACHPKLADQALTTDRSIGLLLPCNVTLRTVEGGIEVSILDPELMFQVVDPAIREKLQPVAADAKSRLQKALDALG